MKYYITMNYLNLPPEFLLKGLETKFKNSDKWIPSGLADRAYGLFSKNLETNPDAKKIYRMPLENIPEIQKDQLIHYIFKNLDIVNSKNLKQKGVK